MDSEVLLIIFEKSKYYPNNTHAGETLGLPPIILHALYARGIDTQDKILRFLNPSADNLHDPYLLPDMESAVAKIRLAIARNERICVFGDYDVDGVCATAMLFSFLRSVGADCIYHIPSRKEEGYGMSELAVANLSKRGVKLIITVDNGISASKEIKRCYELGMDVIVTDHHIPGDTVPLCTAVVCHTIESSQYPNRTLCGAGIAFKLLHALAGLNEAMRYVSLAGLATVADVVPLTDENRILVKLGLDALAAGNCPDGFKKMLESIPGVKKPYTSANLGFAIAPRLNAAGRMSDASLAVELFLSHDSNRIEEIISELNRLNELRQQEEAGILSSASKQLSLRNLSDTRAIVLKSKDWNQGVIGIAASRISEMFHRPTILFSESEGMLKGSARSIDGINIHSVLSSLSECFERFGGHAKAAGITMRVDRFDEFIEKLECLLKADYPNSIFVPRRKYEFDIDLSDISSELVHQIEMLAPFGEGNPSPIFRCRNAFLSHIRRFGSDGQHMRMNVKSDVSHSIEAVWFGSGEHFDRLLSASTVDILFTIDINRRSALPCLQLRLIAVNIEMPVDAHAFIDSGMPRFCSAFIENHCYCYHQDCPQIEKIDVDIGKLSGDSLSGLLILVFSPNAAECVLNKVASETDLNIDVCYTRIPTSPTGANTILFAPMIYMLPRSGYDRIVFYDSPPSSSVYGAVARMLPNARLYENKSAHSNFIPVAEKFECSRDFLGFCFKSIQNKLIRRPHSYGELIEKCAQELSAPNYWIEFAVEVFFELDFIRMDKQCAVNLTPNMCSRCLRESPIYSEILRLQGK